MSQNAEGPGFPLTRKRARGFLESSVILAIIVSLAVLLGLDSVEFQRLLEYLKGLNAFSVS
jgi:hypothetical protein